MAGARFVRCLKSDGLGRVELLERDGVSYVRRVACGGRVPGSRWLARYLRRRELRALERLGPSRIGAAGESPRLVEDSELIRTPGVDGVTPRERDVVLRTHVEGLPLHRAEFLPRDYFERLEALVRELHGLGVCHNDLHKEQNLIVLPDGRPGLIDFQLASVHGTPGRVHRSRSRDDQRHCRKHLRRYTRDGRGPAELAHEVASTPRMPRSGAAHLWRKFVKPLYRRWTRGPFGRPDGEERRPSSGPWPRWTGPVRGGSDAPGSPSQPTGPASIPPNG